MHQAASFSPTSGGSAEDGGSAFVGFDMAYGGNLWDWGHTRIGWELGFGLLPINITDNKPMSVTVTQNTYSFDTGGISMPDPSTKAGLPPAGLPFTAIAHWSPVTSFRMCRSPARAHWT